MKRIVVIVLMMAACLGNAQAQLHLKANVQNNHLWRGMEVSDGIVLLTDLSYTMVNDHVTVGLWGGCNSEGSYKEFNHYLNLKAGGWGFALWDTYNFSPGATYNNKEYWNYSAHTTGRFLDATLSYRFQEEKFPLPTSSEPRQASFTYRCKPPTTSSSATTPFRFTPRACGIRRATRVISRLEQKSSASKSSKKHRKFYHNNHLNTNSL